MTWYRNTYLLDSDLVRVCCPCKHGIGTFDKYTQSVDMRLIHYYRRWVGLGITGLLQAVNGPGLHGYCRQWIASGQLD